MLYNRSLEKHMDTDWRLFLFWFIKDPFQELGKKIGVGGTELQFFIRFLLGRQKNFLDCSRRMCLDTT